MNTVEKLILAIEKLSRIAGRIAMYLVGMITIVMSYEVVMRYAFNAPTLWVMELSGYLMTAFIALGAAYTLLTRKHVNVDMLYSCLSSRVQVYVRLCTYPITFLFMYYFAKYGLNQFVISIRDMQVSGTAWDPVIWPVKLVLFVGVALTLLQAVAEFIKDFYVLVTRKQLGSFSADNQGGRK
ncbi:MAG: TRAP transporter small permease subunit [Deltaproteobacteria bacterium]|nr:TRAP transporter small permease subunit [Deltaproteobacteria bacterium]